MRAAAEEEARGERRPLRRATCTRRGDGLAAGHCAYGPCARTSGFYYSLFYQSGRGAAPMTAPAAGRVMLLLMRDGCASDMLPTIFCGALDGAAAIRHDVGGVCACAIARVHFIRRAPPYLRRQRYARRALAHIRLCAPRGPTRGAPARAKTPGRVPARKRSASPHIAAPSHAQVIQSPMASVILHLLPLFDGLLVLFMARNCLDVFRSQNKVSSCSFLKAHRTPTTCSADSVDPPSGVCRCFL